MPNSDKVFVDQSIPPQLLYPRTRDRGSNIRETVVGLSDNSGNQIDPAQDATVAAIVTALRGGVPNAVRVLSTGNLSVLNDAATLALDGMNTAIVQLLTTGTWSAGSVVFEGSVDGAATWFAVNMVPVAGGTSAGSLSSGVANTPQAYEMACGGFTHMRARATGAITGGPVAAVVAATNGLKSLRVGAPSANPVPVAPALTAPTDGATTSQSLASVVSVGSRAAEPNSLGLWYAQNQSASVMYLVFYAADGTTRLATIAIDPGAGAGRQGGDIGWQQAFGPFKGPMTLFGATGAQATLVRQ